MLLHKHNIICSIMRHIVEEIISCWNLFYSQVFPEQWFHFKKYKTVVAFPTTAEQYYPVARHGLPEGALSVGAHVNIERHPLALISWSLLVLSFCLRQLVCLDRGISGEEFGRNFQVSDSSRFIELCSIFSSAIREIIGTSWLRK